jgi:uncharacterized membrane protein YphA (DoxX/SURF4 family)/thiol-disulfide isomerase/thioredoxin
MKRAAPNTRQLGYRFIIIVLGVILLAAGLFKGLDLDQFARQIRQYGLLPDDAQLIHATAWFMVVVEIGLGAALLSNWRPKFTLSAVSLLLLIFIGVLFWAMVHGGVSDCGCFGPAARRNPKEALIEDVLLLSLAVAAWRIREKTLYFKHPAKTWTVAMACILAMALPLAAGTTNPVQREHAPAAAPGGVGMVLQSKTGGQIDLNAGVFLVVLMSTDCNHCRESVPILNQIAADAEDTITIYALAADDRGDVDRFIEDNFAFYPVFPVDEKSLLSLMEDAPLPQYLLIRNGNIVARWHEQVPELNALIDLTGKAEGA